MKRKAFFFALALFALYLETREYHHAAFLIPLISLYLSFPLLMRSIAKQFQSETMFIVATLVFSVIGFGVYATLTIDKFGLGPFGLSISWLVELSASLSPLLAAFLFPKIA